MATYSLNTTISISGAIAVAGASPVSYTVPASSYAEVQVGSNNTFANASVTIGGVTVIPASVGGTQYGQKFTVGPGQTITVNNPGGLNASISGVLFTNSP